MDKDKLIQLSDNAIKEYFDGIDNTISEIVYKIADANGIEDESDIDFLKRKIGRGILKLDSI